MNPVNEFLEKQDGGKKQKVLGVRLPQSLLVLLKQVAEEQNKALPDLARDALIFVTSPSLLEKLFQDVSRAEISMVSKWWKGLIGECIGSYGKVVFGTRKGSWQGIKMF